MANTNLSSINYEASKDSNNVDDYFEALFEARPSKNIFIVFSLTGILIIIPLIYR